MVLRELYPERTVFKTHRLRVSEIHELHIEESGNPNGKPVLFNHGGPGTGIFPVHGRQFDPQFFRIIQFDQRGSGKSTPYADIRENTTQELIRDIEKIREYLGIECWIVAGRSWGATLSLLYAQAYPERVKALFLVAVFLCDKQANRWLFQDGASHIFPEQWQNFVELVPEADRHDMFAAYQKLLFSADSQLARRAARSWTTWEAHTCSIVPTDDILNAFTSEEVVLALARLECHYLSNGGFIQEGQILEASASISHIPTKIIHGRYDMNCTYDNATRLREALANSELFTIPLGGHSAADPDSIDKQVRAADSLKALY